MALEIKIKRTFNKEGIVLSAKESEQFEGVLKKYPFQDKTTFQKLLLQEQLEILNSEQTRPKKWHPAIIQWCIYMSAKSTTTGEATGMEQVQNLSTALCDYSTSLVAKSGFTEEALIEMIEKINYEELETHQKYFSLTLDEIKIRDQLVFKKTTGQLIGFQNLDDFGNKINEAEKRFAGSLEIVEGQSPHTTHLMQLTVRGLTTTFKFPFAFFPSSVMTANELYSIVWNAIANLQGAGFNILVVVCSNTTVNQKLIKATTQSHKEDQGDKVGFRSKNLFSYGSEQLYFIYDICQLIKTTRNCLKNSGKVKNPKDGSEKPVRLLSKNGKQILWQHFIDMFQIDSQNHPRKAPKVTQSHVNLNPFNVMRVNLATEILSSTVANAMEDILGESSSETVKFIRIFDTLFDILNVSNLTDCQSKGKPALEPFKKIDDWRFKWLEEDFLGYLDEWEDEVSRLEVEEDFVKDRKLLRKELMEELRVTVYSSIAVIKYLINKEAAFVLSSKFNEDPLELCAAIEPGENSTTD